VITIPPDQIAAIILCGGRSRRFGTDKAMALCGGVTLLQNAIACAGTRADGVILAYGPGRYAAGVLLGRIVLPEAVATRHLHSIFGDADGDLFRRWIWDCLIRHDAILHLKRPDL